MRNTRDLIDSLVADATPVRRLHRPSVRVACWLLLAALLLALVALVHGVRPDLALKLQQPVYVTNVAAAIVTGILAAAAAFIASVPGRSRRWLLLPLPSLAVWVGTIGYDCLTNWVEIGPEGMSPGETARCFATLVVVSTPLSIALTAMLRYVARLSPAPVAMCAGLAVAAMAATSLLLIHPLDASAMVLLWNLGVALLFVGAGSLFGRPIASVSEPRV
ncbi:Negative regulator of sigma F [compost metagenome]